jgi:hypothetical protein
MEKLLRYGLYATMLVTSIACSKPPLPGDGDLEVPSDSSATAPTDTIPPAETNFYFGVNGHPVNQSAYMKISPAEQIRLIKSLGMNIYRVDLTADKAGVIRMHDRYVALKNAADSAKVTLLPMVSSGNFDYDIAEEASYQIGYERGAAFASNYQHDFVYYNIANELDNKCILPKKSGTSVSHYDPVKFKIIAARLKGMDDGVKSVDKDAKTMVDASWMHYQFLLMLEEYGVNFDVVAYHWYDEMEKLAVKTYNITDITQFLSQKFSKPIWFTEINIRNKVGTVDDKVQRDFLNSFLAKCKENRQVQAAIIYELFNQPVFQSLESHYGLFDWVKPYTEYVPKLWAKEVSILISKQ